MIGRGTNLVMITGNCGQLWWHTWNSWNHLVKIVNYSILAFSMRVTEEFLETITPLAHLGGKTKYAIIACLLVCLFSNQWDKNNAFWFTLFLIWQHICPIGQCSITHLAHFASSKSIVNSFSYISLSSAVETMASISEWVLWNRLYLAQWQQ